MTVFIGRDREARYAYGFDEVAIVPGNITIDPQDTDVSTSIGPIKLKIPFLASAMDGVVSPEFAVEFNRLGGLAVLNIEGIYTRYNDVHEVIEEIVNSPLEQATKVIKKIYKEPVKDALIEKVIRKIKAESGICAVSCVPQSAKRYAYLVEEIGADILFIQGTVITKRHISSRYEPTDLSKICADLKIPVVLGNCVTYHAALELMETGCCAILVGVGPGSACTTRQVLGIGVPQITSTIDCAAARDYFYRKTSKYVSVITDGGMLTSGDICKAFVAGADCVMLGGAFARAAEAPGKGYHWGMAMPDFYLPRGTKIFVGTTATLREIVFGPARTDDGTQNLVGALKTCMGMVGARNIRELQLAELIVAPEITTEGKKLQKRA